MTDIQRGDVYYIHPVPVTGSEQGGGRPAVIISNNLCNRHSDVVEVAFLTTKPKKELPTHVSIESLYRKSTALCEQIESVSKDRIGSYYGKVTPGEIRKLDTALAISIGINHEIPEAPDNKISDRDKEMIKVKIERDTYKELYMESLRGAVK